MFSSGALQCGGGWRVADKLDGFPKLRRFTVILPRIGFILGLGLVVSGCGSVPPLTATAPLKGTLTTMPGAPHGRVFIEFVGHWSNLSKNTVVFLSTTPAKLQTSGQTFYPWQYRAEIHSEFAHKNPQKASKVPVVPGLTIRWSNTFAIPEGLCNAPATVHIKGLPGVVRARIPCASH